MKERRRRKKHDIKKKFKKKKLINFPWMSFLKRETNEERKKEKQRKSEGRFYSHQFWVFNITVQKDSEKLRRRRHC